MIFTALVPTPDKPNLKSFAINSILFNSSKKLPDNTIISTGLTILPSLISNPEACTLKSPETVSTPACKPDRSVIYTPCSIVSNTSSKLKLPGSNTKFAGATEL